MKVRFSYKRDRNLPIVDCVRQDLISVHHQIWLGEQDSMAMEDWRRTAADRAARFDAMLCFVGTNVIPNELLDTLGSNGTIVISVLLEHNANPILAFESIQSIDMKDWLEHISSPEFREWYESWQSCQLMEDFKEGYSGQLKEYDGDAVMRMLRVDERFQAWYQQKLQAIRAILTNESLLKRERELNTLHKLLPLEEFTIKRYVLEHGAYCGRVWLERAVNEWVNNANVPKTLLITSAPGVGKSSFVTHQLLFGENVGAVVYCEAYNPKQIACTIAYQLACRFPDYRALLIKQLVMEQDQQKMGNVTSKTSAFERYVINPICKSIDGDRPTTVILIDGIDELERADAGRGQAEELPRMLQTYAPRLPSWLRFVVTCRRHSAALSYMREATHIDIDETGEPNLRDVREYVGLRLGLDQASPLVSKVMASCSGVFLHAALLCDEISNGWIREDEVSGIPSSLGEVYRRYFERMFVDADEDRGGYAGESLLGCYEAMSALVTFNGAIPERTLMIAAGWERPGLAAFLRRCGHFLTTTNGEVSFIHKSIPDWLVSDAAGEYVVDAGVGWRSLAVSCYTQFENGVQRMNDFELMNLVRCVDEARMSCRLGTPERGRFSDMLSDVLRSKRLGKALLRRGKENLAARRYAVAETYLRDATRVFSTRAELDDGRSHRSDVGDLADAYRDLAEAIDLAVRLEESIGCCERGVEALRDIGEIAEGCEHEVDRGVGRLLMKRAYVYYRMGGHEREYIDGYQEAYRIFTRIGERRLAVEALWRLGVGYRLNGNSSAAVECSRLIEETLDTERCKQDDPEFFCFVRVYQGDFHVNAGQYDKAERYLLEAGEVSTRPGVHLPDVRKAQLNLQLSSLYYNQGRYGEAEPRALVALELERVVYGDGSVESCNGLNQLGFCQMRLGKAEEALASFEESYRIRNRLYGHANPFTMFSLRNCGLASMELGGEHLTAAKDDFLEVLARRKELLAGERNQMRVAETQVDLSNVCMRMGDAQEALDYAQDAERTFSESFDSVGSAKRSFAGCYVAIAEALMVLDRTDEARERLERAVELYEQVFGADSTHQIMLKAKKLLSKSDEARVRARRRINVGIQNFEDIRLQGAFYVDKTGLIREWWENLDQVTLVCRPRRFGKTLNLDMIRCFFSTEYLGRGEELFSGLDVWEENAKGDREKYRSLQGRIPVIFISFADVKDTSYDEMVKHISIIIAKECERFSYLYESDKLSTNEQKRFYSINDSMDVLTCKISINLLCGLLHKYHGIKPIVLLDEYDTPMQEAWSHGYWNDACEFMRGLMNSTFKTNGSLLRAMITGINRISQKSIFSDLNNLFVVNCTSIFYQDFFGFTKSEVDAALDEYGLVGLGKTVDYWYGGFTTDASVDIYNPWSIIQFLKNRRFDTYWANTSSNLLVSKLIQGGNNNIKTDFEMLLSGKTVVKPIYSQLVFDDLYIDANALWTLLLTTGYLKKRPCFHPNALNGNATLQLVNHEIELCFNRMIDNWFKQVAIECNDFANALISGNAQLATRCLSSVTETCISSFDAGCAPSKSEPERFYHGLVLGMLVSLRNRYVVESNRESGFGRYDVMLEPRNRHDVAIIIEFKVFDYRIEKSLKETVARAHEQIEDKRYATSLIARGFQSERILSYGIAFEGKRVLVG